MPSSTSNTDNKAIFCIRLALWSAAVALLYVLLLLIAPKSDDAPDMYSTNILKAQTYMSHNDDHRLLIVGSSMSATLPFADPSCYNLAFYGGCSLTGLKLIVEKGKLTGFYPDAVFVEMNISVCNGTDDDLLYKASGAGNIWINRIENRPDQLFYSIVKKLYYCNKENALYDFPTIKEKVDFWANVRSSETDQDTLNNYLKEAADYCSILNQNGVRVILMEPPNDISLYDLPQTRQVRETALAYFPKDEYEWFTVDWSDYTVSDGIHLGDLSAKRYSDALLEWYAAHSNP